MEEEEKTCPICKKSIRAQNFLTHEAYCSNQKKNCVIIEEELPPKNDQIKIGKNQSILEENNEIFECPNCLLNIPIEILEMHLKECEQRPTPCRYCNNPFPNDLIERHQESCEQKSQNQLPEEFHDFPQQNVSNFQSDIYDYNNYNQVPNNNNQVPNYINNQDPRYNYNNQNQYEEYKANENNFNEIRQEQVFNNGNVNQRIVIRQLPGGGISYSRSISNSSQPNSNMNRRNSQNQGNSIENEMNNFRVYNQSHINQDPFENFDSFFNQRFHFPRGFHSRSLLRNQFDLNQIPFLLSQLGGVESQGLSKEELGYLEKYPFVKRSNLSEEDLKCVICYSEFAENEEIRCLPCFHKFHVVCIDKWFEKNTKCPICKHDLQEDLMRNINEDERII